MASSQSDDAANRRPSWYNVTLEDIIPYRGFVFQEDHNIFEEEQHWVLVKMALQVFAPALELQKVDIALAAIMNDTIRIAAEYRESHPYEIFVEADHISTIPVDAVFEEARKQSIWALDLPSGLVPHLMHKLIRGRHLYNKFTHFRGTPKRDLLKKPGQLATAIDEWLREKPVEKPDEEYARTPAEMIDYMMERMLEGKGADWDAFDDDDENDHSDYEDNRTMVTEDDTGLDVDGTTLGDSTMSLTEAQVVTKISGPDENFDNDLDVTTERDEGSMTRMLTLRGKMVDDHYAEV
ncbi:hypothetical protein F4820DRAFT_431819 [Hypoxylon rubiginosum]|uniref:Uncharacterized protein n=1 Tax=Hypoxylon rubiginosum TaxID=110542 RepID=A0ACB9YS04_9PEZI|nr:hypothetical protein F4820DRAFT_431819 [Hypoxylon rubiginosum]